MAEVNTTAAVQQLAQNNPDNQIITDESLNAGSLLPSEPVVPTPDVLTTEIKVAKSAIADLIPVEGDEVSQQVSAIDARHVELSYLRDDIVSSDGMSQKLAAEAIAIKPTFGRNRSLAYYSKHPSQTMFQASLEEIDQTIQDDVVVQLGLITGQLNDHLQKPIGMLGSETFDWMAYRNALLAVEGEFVTFVGLMHEQEYNWDEQALCSDEISPDHTAYLAVAQSLAHRSDFYISYLHLPAALEMHTRQLVGWKDALNSTLEQLKATSGKAIKFVSPAEEKVSLFSDKPIKLSQLGETLQTLHDEGQAYKGETFTVDQLLKHLGDVALEAPIGEIVTRIRAVSCAAQELIAAVSELASYVKSFDRYSADLTFVTDTAHSIAKELAELSSQIRSIHAFSVGYVFSFIQALHHSAEHANKVSKAAWEIIQKTPVIYQTQQDARELIELTLKRLDEDTNNLCV